MVYAFAETKNLNRTGRLMLFICLIFDQYLVGLSNMWTFVV
jgi:hypothetical protein